MFSVKGSKEYAGIFLFSKFELYWAAFIFVKIHNRKIGIWIEHFFQSPQMTLPESILSIKTS